LSSLAENRKVNEALLPYVPRLVVDWLRTGPSDRYRRIHGTLAFVDISGFTKLAERLARKGKVGAEELSDTLNSTFTELLSVAYEYGAGVIKWGGDAVLLLFEGDEHELRAARGMAEMQRTIRRVGRIRTEGGNVVLRMSIGVNSGAFDFFLVGESHRELLIAGEAATATVALEAAADAGEIVVAPSTAAALPQRNLGTTKGPGFLLRGAPEATVWPASHVGEVGDLPIDHCIPVAIREHLLLTDREPEHRNIAVSFVEFRGTDGLILSRGGDEVAEALHACISNVQSAVERHSATFHETDISKDGGKILLLSGAPRSAGDDEERILRTVRSILDDETALPLRAGVNCGPVFSGDFGPPYRRTFSVKGDAVNLAARLMGKAETGEIVASDEVVRRSRTVFAIQQLEPFFVKGKSAAIRAHTVAGVRGRSGPVAEAPLVGRERELQELFEALASARDWQGRYVEIAAEPGMGKSRLVDELRAKADGTTVVSTACVEYESATPYYAVRSLLRMLLGLEGLDEAAAAERLTTLVAELAPRLLPWLPLLALPLHIDVPSTVEVESLKDEFRKSRLEEVVQELLGLGLLAPTIMLFEDIHWMDEASRELLGVLVDHLEDRPWLLVATTRPSPAGLERQHPWTRRLELAPLAEDDALQLLEDATAEAPLPPHQLELLRGRALGNPLYLRELVAAARRLGGVEELPESVGGVIGAQIDRLSPADRTALRRAAVLGVTFEERLLRTVVDDMSTVEFCNRLGEFLETSPGRIRFRHALVRDTAYEGLSYRRRRELHGAVADAIVGGSDGAGEAEAALLSLHYHEAQRYPEAWRYSLAAGRSAMAMYANSDSERFLERAVDSAHRLTDLPRREVAKAYELLGEVRLRLADYDRGGVSLREARRLLSDDPVESARLMLREGVIQWRRGRHGQAMRWIRRGMRLLEGVEGTEAQKHRAQLYVWHGVVRLRQGRAREAIEWCRRAIAEATAADARRPLAHGYYILDYALTSLGRYAEAVHAERALAIYEELGDLNEQATVLNQLGILAYYQGRWDDAIDYYRRAEDAWERAGDRWLGSFPTANRAELLSDQGRLEEAEPLLRGALRVAVAAGAPGRIADVKSHLGRVAARAGRFDEALEALEESRAIYESDSVLSEVLLMDARIAECLAFAGDAKGALARCDEALARAASLDDLFVLLPVLHRLRGWALLATGRLDEGVEALSLSMEAAGEKEVVYEVALTADALAQGQRLRGEDASELEALRDAIFSTLGVVDAGVLVLPQMDGAGLRRLTRVG
jgi:class 3 adenylate cyclase/tetratricopeptide (TPR) repeat protein